MWSPRNAADQPLDCLFLVRTLHPMHKNKQNKEAEMDETTEETPQEPRRVYHHAYKIYTDFSPACLSVMVRVFRM